MTSMTHMPPDAPSRALGAHAVGVAVITAISVAAFFVVVQPALHMRIERTAMEMERDDQHRLAEELDQTTTRLQGELEELDQQLAASEIQLQSSRYLNARIAHIIEHAANGNVDIYETRPGTVRDHRRYQTVPILLAGRGTYSNCAAFLHRLHESLPDTGVVEFELTGHPADRRTPASFRFNLVWYAEPASAGVP